MPQHPDEVRTQQEPNAEGSTAGCLARLFWMMLGNLLLAVAAFKIFEGPSFGLTGADVAYWLTVACLAGVRYADIRYWGGKKADGDPATMSDWQRYSVILISVAAAAWGVLHLVAEHSL
ncbi:MAG: hypothetical protein GXY83_21185 [Rhodopirellula sp.]|nr:hypothetical protein [Rhodopirellula sp.]